MNIKDIFNKYTIVLFCTNCHESQNVSIEKGVTAKEYLEENPQTCDNCGCNTLKVSVIQ